MAFAGPQRKLFIVICVTMPLCCNLFLTSASTTTTPSPTHPTEPDGDEIIAHNRTKEAQQWHGVQRTTTTQTHAYRHGTEARHGITKILNFMQKLMLIPQHMTCFHDAFSNRNNNIYSIWKSSSNSRRRSCSLLLHTFSLEFLWNCELLCGSSSAAVTSTATFYDNTLTTFVLSCHVAFLMMTFTLKTLLALMPAGVRNKCEFM